jgi:hypothetical protein
MVSFHIRRIMARPYHEMRPFQTIASVLSDASEERILQALIVSIHALTWSATAPGRV